VERRIWIFRRWKLGEALSCTSRTRSRTSRSIGIENLAFSSLIMEDNDIAELIVVSVHRLAPTVLEAEGMKAGDILPVTQK
jgi:hypothetical protein